MRLHRLMSHVANFARFGASLRKRSRHFAANLPHFCRKSYHSHNLGAVYQNLMKRSQNVGLDVILSHAKHLHRFSSLFGNWGSSITRKVLKMVKKGCSTAITRMVCTRIWWDPHRMSVSMLSCRMQKISIGFRVRLRAGADQTQGKCLKWSKTGAAWP